MRCRFTSLFDESLRQRLMEASPDEAQETLCLAASELTPALAVLARCITAGSVNAAHAIVDKVVANWCHYCSHQDDALDGPIVPPLFDSLLKAARKVAGLTFVAAYQAKMAAIAEMLRQGGYSATWKELFVTPRLAGDLYWQFAGNLAVADSLCFDVAQATLRRAPWVVADQDMHLAVQKSAGQEMRNGTVRLARAQVRRCMVAAVESSAMQPGAAFFRPECIDRLIDMDQALDALIAAATAYFGGYPWLCHEAVTFSQLDLLLNGGVANNADSHSDNDLMLVS